MRNFNTKIESLFIHFSNYCYTNPYKILSLILGSLVYLAIQIPSLNIDTTSESLLHNDDPELVQYTEFRSRFGRPELIIIMVETDEIFSEQFLFRLRTFHKDLESSVPYVRSVTSLVNIRELRYEKPTLVVKEFLQDWPGADLEELKARAEASRLYENFILSEDGKTTAVIIETMSTVGDDNHFFGAKENIEVVQAVYALVSQYNQSGFKLTASGEPIIEEAFNRATLKDMLTSVSLSLLCATFFLIILFRRPSGVFLSVVITLCTLLSTMGLMAFFKLPVKIITIVVPAFIAAVSIAASVHILVIFFKRLQKENHKKEAITFAMGHSGLAILMTSLTTAAGLLSFSFAELGAIAEVGYVSAAGVMLAFIYTITLLPAAIAILPIRQSSPSRQKRHSLMDTFLLWTARYSCEYPHLIISLSAALFIVSLIFIFNLSFSHNIIEFFPKNSKEREHLFAIDSTMKGSLSLELVVTPPNKDPFDLATMNRLDKFSQEIKKLKIDGVSIGKIFSSNDVVKEMNLAFNFNKPWFYVIPQNQDIITFGVDRLEHITEADLSKVIHKESGNTRMTVITTWADAIVFKNLISSIQQKFSEIFKDGSTLVTTGLIALLAQAIHAAIMSMVTSYSAAFLVITMMMILVLGSVKKGLLSMIPNLLPIIIIMGLMGLLQTPLDLNSLMIGSIAIGLVVDDTVHFMYNFQKYYSISGNTRQAVQQTLLGSGKAMLITSLVLSTGFFILLAASLNHVVRFGIFTGLTILVALLGDFFLAPALMVVYHRKKLVEQTCSKENLDFLPGNVSKRLR